MKSLIGLHGKKQSGKDTTGEILSNISGYPTFAFADTLKKFCGEIFPELNYQDLWGPEKNKEKIRVLEIDYPKERVLQSYHEYLSRFMPSITDPEVFFRFCRDVFVNNRIEFTENFIRIKDSPRRLLQLIGTEFARGINDNIWIEIAEQEYKDQGSLIITDVRFKNEAEWIHKKGGSVIQIIGRDNSGSKDLHSSESGIPGDLIDVKLDNSGDIKDLKNGVIDLWEYNIKNQGIIL